jgi:hypothetical protein
MLLLFVVNRIYLLNLNPVLPIVNLSSDWSYFWPDQICTKADSSDHDQHSRFSMPFVPRVPALQTTLLILKSKTTTL